MVCGRWLRGLIGLAVGQAVAAAATGYAEPTACAECHPAIARNFSKTGMARTFRPAASSLAAHLQSLNFDHQPSGQHFGARRTDDGYYLRRTAVSGREQVIGAFEQRVDYTIGSGDRAINYLHRSADGQLIELPVSWYSSEGRWGMSPGYDSPDHLGFSRAISYRCMFCHNAYPDVAEGASNWDGATVFPSKLPEGIDCQRCHGPGAGHIAAVRQGKSKQEIQASIVNPTRLTPERQLEVCMQCHLETTSAQLPGSLMRVGQGVFSYRAGQPLANYILYFDHAPGTGNDDKFEFVSSAYRLRKSACFAATEGRLTCTVCHDPHQEQSREESLRKTNLACLKCHEDRMPALVSRNAHPQFRDCASCHMPRRVGVDAVHIPVTDHWIQRPAKVPPVTPTVERNDANTLPYAGEVAPYYPAAVDPIYAAIAQVNGFANLSVGLTNLERLLTEQRPKEPDPYFEMGEALIGAGQAGRSIFFYQQAVRIEPQNWRYLFGLGLARKAAGAPAQGVPAMERAKAVAPDETSLWNGLGVQYALAGRTADALTILREAVARNPEDAAAHNNLGQALARSADLRNAVAELREAARVRPEMVQFRMNLAEVLMRTGQFREAAAQIAEMIRMGPSTAVARGAWFTALAAGNVQEARVQYERSLRKQTAGFHDNLGTALISLHDSEGAIREYREAIAADPQSATAALNLGLTLASQNQPDEARRWLQESLRLNPDQPDAHLRLGALLLAAGLRIEAVGHLKIAAGSPDPKLRGDAEKLLDGVK